MKLAEREVWCQRCECVMAPRGGYLMGGSRDFIAYLCPKCGNRMIDHAPHDPRTCPICAPYYPSQENP